MPGKSKRPPPARKTQQDEATRLAAKTVYTSNFKALSLHDMRKLPAFSGVSVPTLRKWSQQDNWVLARQRNFAAFRRALEVSARAQWVASGKGQMSACESIRRMSGEMLRHNALQPRSWEAVAKVGLDALKLEGELVAQFGASLLPQDADGAEVPLPPEAAALAAERMTDAEALVAAHAVLDARRTQDAAVSPPPAEVMDAPEKP